VAHKFPQAPQCALVRDSCPLSADDVTLSSVATEHVDVIEEVLAPGSLREDQDHPPVPGWTPPKQTSPRRLEAPDCYETAAFSVESSTPSSTTETAEASCSKKALGLPRVA
jgi:hypothetical protein